MRTTATLLQILTGLQLAVLALCSAAYAQGYKTVQEKVRVPVAEIKNRDFRETTYEPEYTTEMKQVQQTYLQPVVRYQLRNRVDNWWNPFAPTYVTQYAVPVLQWEPRTVSQKMAVTTAKMKPVTRVVSRPTRVLRFEEQTRTRVVQTPAPMTTAPILARRQPPLRPVFNVAPQPAATPAVQPSAVAATTPTTTPSRVTVRPPAATTAAPSTAAVASRPAVNVAPGAGGVRVGGGAIAPSAPATGYGQPAYAPIPAPTYNAAGVAVPAAGQPAAAVAERWGGVSRLDTDPPRFGRRLPGSTGRIIR